jgi:hypothetical protein
METMKLSKTGKPVITMTVIKEETGYSAFAEVGNNSIFTDFETFDELKDNIIEAVNLTFEDKGFSYTIDEILFSFNKSEYNSDPSAGQVGCQWRWIWRLD